MLYSLLWEVMVDLQIEIGYHYFRKKGVIQMEDRFLENMKIVEQAIREAGYVPSDQLYGYVQTGNWNRGQFLG